MSAPLVSTDTPGVYRRGGRYVAIYRDPAGRQRSKSARTIKEAKAIRATHAADVHRGEFREQSRVRFADYAREWIDSYQGRRGRFRETTRQEYRRTLEQRAIPFFARHTLSSITPGDVRRYVLNLSANGALSDSSIANAVKPLRACLATAVQEDLIRHNPARDVVLPHREDAEAETSEPVRALAREQLGAFLRIVNPRYRLFFALLAATGLRISEIVALEWQHLQLDGAEPHVRVRQTIVRGRKHAPKSRHGRRDVPISFALVDDLRAHHGASEWPRDTDPVFASQTGTPLLARNVRRRYLDPVMGEIGAEGLGFHSFRHLYASMQFARGANPVQVQRLLGHHSPAFTMATYVHLLDGQGAPALDLGLELRQVTAKVTAEPTVVSVNQP